MPLCSKYKFYEIKRIFYQIGFKYQVFGHGKFFLQFVRYCCVLPQNDPFTNKTQKATWNPRGFRISNVISGQQQYHENPGAKTHVIEKTSSHIMDVRDM